MSSLNTWPVTFPFWTRSPVFKMLAQLVVLPLRGPGCECSHRRLSCKVVCSREFNCPNSPTVFSYCLTVINVQIWCKSVVRDTHFYTTWCKSESNLCRHRRCILNISAWLSWFITNSVQIWLSLSQETPFRDGKDLTSGNTLTSPRR